MEDNLNFFLNGRRPQIFQKLKVTLTFQKIEDNLNFFKNERQPQYFQKCKTTTNLFWWKTTQIFSKWKTTAKPKHILGLAKLSKIFLLLISRSFSSWCIFKIQYLSRLYSWKQNIGTIWKQGTKYFILLNLFQASLSREIVGIGENRTLEN